MESREAACAIQPHGVLLAVAEHDLAIAMASTNAERILGVAHARLLGAPLSVLLGSDGERALRERLDAGATTEPLIVATARGRFETALHRASGLLVMELEPAGPRGQLARAFDVVARLHTADTLRELAQVVADELRALTATGRVTVYRGTLGDPIADSRADELGTDGPRMHPIHCLHPHERSRFVADREAATVRVESAPLLTPIALDLSRAQLRPLAHAGPRASLSFAIVVDGKPWGVVACEHATPLSISLETRVAAERIVETLGAQIALRERLGGEARAASAAKDELLALVSHELRTPLNAMLGWLRLIEAGHVSADAQRSALATVTRNATALGELVEELLDLSRIVTGKMRLDIQPVQPAAIIEAALASVKPLADAKSIRIDTELDLAVGPVAADANRLQQVLWNLLSNAVKFTPEGGHIRVTLARRSATPGVAEIVVADTGIGIAPDFLPHVFDRFRQAPQTLDRTKRGLGLGLSIVHHLVEQHGGSVQAASAGIGKGATFTVHVPIAESRAQTGPFERVGPSFEPAPELRGLRVVAVDDERDANDLVRAVLTASGVEVFTATSAAEVLELVPRVRPHVLISDIGMPDVDGYELIQRVRKLASSDGGRTPAIAVTAFARAQDRSRAFLAGFDLYLAKPIDPAELTAVIVNLSTREGRVTEPAEPPKLRGELAGARVLVIDDDQDAAELLGLILERHGATVAVALSAGEGGAKVRSFRPDILVSDISLPDQDGYAFMRELRARGPDEGGWIPAIAVSGHASPEDVKRAILAGFQLHVAKPIDPQDLIARLARLVSRTSRRT